MNKPSLDDLECLNTWPKRTKAYDMERELISDLLVLCRLHGFGRVPQLASEIGEIWRDPNKIESFNRRKERQMEFMEECRKVARTYEIMD